MAATSLRACWNAITAWSPARAKTEMQRFADRQPVVVACVTAYLEEEGRDAGGQALMLALALDGYYAGLLGRAPAHIKERAMERALDEAERGFAELAGVEPALALRRMLARREAAPGEVLAALLELTMEEADRDPALGQSVGAVFVVGKALALAYQRANGLPAASASLGEAIETRLGGPLPRVGRNDPCPCGSGRKFKKCCGRVEVPPHPPASSAGRGEDLFLDYMHLVKGVMLFYQVACREKDGRWLRERNKEFEQRFRPGEPGGAPDSLHTGWLLFDLRLPSSRKTVGELFVERHGRGLVEPGPTRLRELCASYTTFHEVLALLPEQGQKRVRELATDVEWTVMDIEDTVAREGRPGDLWLCRLVGPRDDAVTLMTPIIYPAKGRDGLERLVRHLLDAAPACEPREAMKRATPFLAEFLLASQQKVEPSTPVLSNTDGDPLLPTTLVYDIDSTDAAFERLADLTGRDGPEVERSEDGKLLRATIPWSKERPDGPLEHLLFATLRLEPGRLTVEVNSRRRATAVRRLIARRLGTAACLRQTIHEPMEAKLREARRDPERREKAQAEEERQELLFAEHPEAGRALEEHLTRYYRRWLDMPLPALRGETPRAAAQSEEGRSRVRALVDDLDRIETGSRRTCRGSTWGGSDGRLGWPELTGWKRSPCWTRLGGSRQSDGAGPVKSAELARSDGPGCHTPRRASSRPRSDPPR